jgi:alpha-glucosidase
VPARLGLPLPGEELGLTEAYVAYEDLQDPYGIRFWPNFKGRDGCRTPMPWISDNQNGGFSDAKPWLPMAVEHLHRAVGNQEGKADSTLAFYRAMIGFRKGYPALPRAASRWFRPMAGSCPSSASTRA